MKKEKIDFTSSEDESESSHKGAKVANEMLGKSRDKTAKDDDTAVLEGNLVLQRLK